MISPSPFSSEISRRICAKAAALAAALIVGALLVPRATDAQTPDANTSYRAAVDALDHGDYRSAVDNINAFLADMPPADREKLTSQLEPVYYNLGASYYNLKDWSKADAAFEDYLSKYPGGAHVVDVKYHRAACLFATQKSDEAAAACREWLDQYPQDQRRAEVLSLLGDAQAAAGHPDEALDAYSQSYKAATTDEVLRHSLLGAARVSQERGDWPAVGKMFEAFVRDRPDHPLAAIAMGWIARADTEEGKTGDAKQVLVVAIGKFIRDRQREGVETLLDQLAQLCVRRDPASTASATPGAELDALLGDTAKDQNPTAQARVLYAKAQLARLLHQDDEANRLSLEIGTKFRTDDLSAVLLGQTGDALLAAGKTDEAKPLFQQLLDAFPKSDVSDFGYCGLGEIALREQKYDDALRLFEGGLDRAAAKLKELTLGKANALLGLRRYDEAKKFFSQVAATHEWRGEATAESVYALGEIEARQEHWAEANAYYQRVYVAYQRYLPWVAKAYLGSAASLEKLGKRQGAINTYRDMLRNQKLARLPEAAEARQQLQRLTGHSPNG